MKNTVKISYVLMISALLCGCGQLEYFEPARNVVTEPSVEVSTSEELPVGEEWIADREAQEIEFRVISNADWTAAVDNSAKSWCSVNPPSSHGDGRLLVKLRYNENATSRKATIRITYNETVFAEFELIQKGAPLIDKNELTVAKFKSSSSIVVAAADTWTSSVRYSDGGGWCSFSAESGESGTYQIDITTTLNPGGARNAWVDIKCGDISETLEITQMGDFEVLTAAIDKGADTLRISWNRIVGATGYRICAAKSGSGDDMGHVDIGTAKTSYDFLPEAGNLFFGYTGMADITVEALTADTEIAPIKGATVTAHTLYDDASGDGTSPEKAFVVSTRRHFAHVKHNASSCFRQSTDIDMDGFDDDASPANGNFTPIPLFSGVYNGENHEIKNLSIALTGTAKEFVAPILLLEGSEDAPAELNGIILTAPSISNLAPAAVLSPTGGLVAKTTANARITACSVKGGSVSGQYVQLVGGVVGQALGSRQIAGCVNDGCTVTGNNSVGGIAGQSSALSMTDCHNTGTVISNAYAGGICGNLIPPGTIGYCYNTGAVTCQGKTNPGTGGIIGRAYGSNDVVCTIDGCFNTGTVSAPNLTASAKHGVGGIIGVIPHQNTFVKNCYNAGSVETVAINADGCGGIVGTYAHNSNIKGDNILVNNYNVGTVEGYAIIGKTSNAATTITGNYYLVTSASEGAVSLTAGFSAMTDAQMKTLSSFVGWDSGVWKEGDASYPYPQLIDNPHK